MRFSNLDFFHFLSKVFEFVCYFYSFQSVKQISIFFSAVRIYPYLACGDGGRICRTLSIDRQVTIVVTIQRFVTCCVCIRTCLSSLYHRQMLMLSPTTSQHLRSDSDRINNPDERLTYLANNKRLSTHNHNACVHGTVYQ